MVLFDLFAVVALNFLVRAGVCYVMIGHYEQPKECQYTRLKLTNLYYIIPHNSPFCQCDYFPSMTYTGLKNPS
jgi:hypothetical protein